MKEGTPMSIENIVQTVMTSKKYSNIIPETINRICNEESIKYKKDKDILRSSKKRLHIISESFLSIKLPVLKNALIMMDIFQQK